MAQTRVPEQLLSIEAKPSWLAFFERSCSAARVVRRPVQ